MNAFREQQLTYEALQKRHCWINEASRLSMNTLCAITRVDEKSSVRGLYAAESRQLQEQGCTGLVEDVQILLPSKDHHKDVSYCLMHICFCHFGPGVVLWMQDGGDEPKSSYSIRHVHVQDTLLSLQANISHVQLLRDVIVDRDASLFNVGSCTACEERRPLDSLSLNVGPEVGGSIPLHLPATATMMDVTQQMDDWRSGTQQQPTQSALRYRGSYFAPHSVVSNTQCLEYAHVSSHASITNATRVTRTLLLPHAQIRDGAVVEDCLLQWNASIQSSHVSSTILMEQASAGPNSLVASSVLGPDVHVSAGEVHHSVLGPNTNTHHQSLLISTLWPLGRGNVGYGANVGSNHTGRLPDQQCYAGEGVFWGLSTVVKFPVSLAPYCLVAAGSTVAPQRVDYPFSLLVNDSILPGWLLQSSPYTLFRNQVKFSQRRKAKRHAYYTCYNILRPSTVEACRRARARLPHDASLTGRARTTGSKAYTHCIQRYVLNILWNQCEQGSGTVDWERAATVALPDEGTWPWNEPDEWPYAAMVLRDEFPGQNLRALLTNLLELERDFVERLCRSKVKDDERARPVIRYHQDTHENDPVLKQARNELQEKEERIAAYLMSSKL